MYVVGIKLWISSQSWFLVSWLNGFPSCSNWCVSFFVYTSLPAWRKMTCPFNAPSATLDYHGPPHSRRELVGIKEHEVTLLRWHPDKCVGGSARLAYKVPRGQCVCRSAGWPASSFVCLPCHPTEVDEDFNRGPTHRPWSFYKRRLKPKNAHLISAKFFVILISFCI